MSRFLVIILVILVLWCLIVPVFASETEPIKSDSGDIPSDSVVATLDPIDTPIIDDSIVFVDSSIQSMNPVTPSDTSGLKAALLGILGNYDAVVVEYRYQNTSGSYSYVREIQPDYVWLCSAAILLVVLFCLFRFLGGIVCKQ